MPTRALSLWRRPAFVMAARPNSLAVRRSSTTAGISASPTLLAGPFCAERSICRCSWARMRPSIFSTSPVTVLITIASQPPGKRVVDEGMRQRVAVAGRRLAVNCDRRIIDAHVCVGMYHVAERQRIPAGAGSVHLGLEHVAMRLGRDRIGGAVQH